VTARARTALVLAVLALAGALLTAPAGARAPRLSARGAIVVEPTTGKVLYAKAPDAPRPIASVTKMMTALVTLERRSLTTRIRVPRYAAQTAESRIGLHAGERLSVADLVTGVLLPSANDAANALAVRIGGTRARFVRLMNAHARREKLRHTHFTTPVGLDSPGNYSTPRDLAKLARILRRNAFARRTMDKPRAVLRTGAHRRLVVNRNRLVAAVPWVNGVKTGHTLRARYVLVGSGRRGGIPVVSVVLGTPSEAARDADSLALLRWGTATFRLAKPLRRGQPLARPAVKDPPDEGPKHVEVVAATAVRRVVRRPTRLRRTVSVPRTLEGPLKKGAVVGKVLLEARGKVIARVDAVTARAVPRPAHGLRAFLVPAIVVGLGGLLLVTAGVLVRRRRRRAARDRERQRRRRRTRPETA
jgi:serine-type D-Ala-D-Ala carboxypeptidase (penicillin-binding protein 5/6)